MATGQQVIHKTCTCGTTGSQPMRGLSSIATFPLMKTHKQGFVGDKNKKNKVINTSGETQGLVTKDMAATLTKISTLV